MLPIATPRDLNMTEARDQPWPSTPSLRLLRQIAGLSFAWNCRRSNWHRI